MSEIEGGPPDSFSNAELVTAVGGLCREDPSYWVKLAKTFAAENILTPLPTTRRGTGVHRRYTLDEVRIASVLFHLKAHGLHHLQLAGVARVIRNGLADMPGFAQRWNAAAAGETPMELNIAPAFLGANRGFGSEELPWVGVDSAGYFRHARVLFTIRLDRIFGEMEIPQIAVAV